MRIAIPVWEKRIAPVFDAAESWILFLSEGKEWKADSSRSFGSTLPESKVQELLDQQVDLLICGAIPYRLERMLSDSGCGVKSFTAGEPEEILQAWSDGMLDDPRFRMPGCRRGRGAGKGRRRRYGDRTRGRV